MLGLFQILNILFSNILPVRTNNETRAKLTKGKNNSDKRKKRKGKENFIKKFLLIRNHCRIIKITLFFNLFFEA